MAEELSYYNDMSEAELMQWAEANPYRINDRDDIGYTPLYDAASTKRSLPLVLWLVDVKGADMNGKTSDGQSPLHGSRSIDLITALLDRGADLTVMEDDGFTPLMWHVYFAVERHELLYRMLQDPRVKANVNMQNALATQHSISPANSGIGAQLRSSSSGFSKLVPPLCLPGVTEIPPWLGFDARIPTTRAR